MISANPDAADRPARPTEMAGCRPRGVRLQMLATDPDEGVELRTPRYHRLGLDYVHQRPDGRVLLGVTAAVTHRWAARVSFTQDLLPVDAQVMPGVRAVGAYSRHGRWASCPAGRRTRLGQLSPLAS